MSTIDPVRAYLHETGCGDHVIRKGLPGLVESWEKTVQAVEAGYQQGLDDYLNDLDARQLLAEALTVATDEQREEVEERIQQADDAMQNLTTITDICLWGDEVAAEEGWTAKQNWWYFARPQKANPDLLAEIDEVVGGL